MLGVKPIPGYAKLNVKVGFIVDIVPSFNVRAGHWGVHLISQVPDEGVQQMNGVLLSFSKWCLMRPCHYFAAVCFSRWHVDLIIIECKTSSNDKCIKVTFHKFKMMFFSFIFRILNGHGCFKMTFSVFVSNGWIRKRNVFCII